jgi:transcriptional regulator with XRE-family HTH domain
MDTAEPAGVPIDGQEVRRRRGLQGDAADAFAEKCQISPAYVSHIECGRRTHVSPPVFVRICDALGIAEGERHVLTRPTVAS